MLALAVVAAVLVVLHVRAVTVLAPDEQAHIDYFFRAPGLQPVVSGTKLSEQAMREEACRGVPNPSWSPPPCDSQVLRPEQFDFYGYDTAYIHPASYYDLTAILARPVQWAFGLHSLVTAGRLVGVLWLAAGLLLTYLVARRLGASPLSTLGILLMAASTPSVLLASATINPDNANLLVGAAVLYLVLIWEERPSKWWLLGIAAVVAVSVRLTNAIVLPAMALYVLMHAVGAETDRRVGEGDHETDGSRLSGAVRPEPRLAIRAAAILCLAGLPLAMGWMLAVRLNATLDPGLQPMNQYLAKLSPSFSVSDVLSALTVYVPPIQPPYVPPPLRGPWVHAIAQVGMGLLAAGMVAPALFSWAEKRLRSLALATLVVAILGGPLVALFYFVSLHQVIPVPTRYGMALLPTVLALTAVALRPRWSGIAIAGFGAAACCTTAASLALGA